MSLIYYRLTEYNKMTFFKSYNIILYSHINKLFTLSLTGGSKGTKRGNNYLRTSISISFYASNWVGDFLLINIYIKARTNVLLSREEMSSRKTLQAGRASFTSCSSNSSFALGVREIPVAFIYRKKCMWTPRGLAIGQSGIYVTPVREMASVMKEFFGPRVIKANYNAKGKQGHVPQR